MDNRDVASLLTFGKTQKLLFVLCGGGWSIAMGVVATISILINELHQEWDLSYSILSLLPIFNMIGIFIGSNFWGILSDKYGRMIAFKRGLLICCIATTISVFSVNFYMLAILFLFIGFGLAASLSVDGAVFLEYTPPNKAHLLTGMSVVCALGAFYANGCAWIFTLMKVPMMWRFLLGVNAFLNFLVVLPRFWIKETPLFLASKGRYVEMDELMGYLNKDYKKSVISNESFLSAAKSQTSAETGNFNGKTDTKSLKVLNLNLSDQIKCLFRKPLKKLTFLYLSVFSNQIWFFTAFTFSGVGAYMPEILRQAGQGGSSNVDIYRSMFIQSLSAVPAVIVATYLVKSCLGRKWTQSLSLLMASILIYSFLIPNYAGLLICSTVYYFFINLMYPVQYAITPETFPIQVRNTAVGICNCINNIGSIIGPLSAALLLEESENLGFSLAFFSFSLIVAAGCAAFVIETKNFDPSSFELEIK